MKQKKRNFNEPQNDAKIFELSNKTFACESRRKIRWAVTMFNDWRVARMGEVLVAPEIRRCDLGIVEELCKEDLSFALCRFIREVKKVDNTDFPPNTVHEIILMIQMHLHQNGLFWRLLDDSHFIKLHNVVDNTMKERCAKGLGVRKSCEVISLGQEDEMFSSGGLGEANLEQLLRTVIYMLGLHLALRGGVEHTRLRRSGFRSQIETEIDEDTAKEVLIYKEDPMQKTNQGGLTSKPNRKVVRVFLSANISRCPVRLYVKYIGLLPSGKSCGKLYLCPKVKFTPAVWFCD